MKEVEGVHSTTIPNQEETITIPLREYEAMKALIASLVAKVEELEARLKKTSKNSDKPPSSDGPRKGTVKNSRVKTGKQSGGQPGHKGATKGLHPQPDTIVNLVPQTDCVCGGTVMQTDAFTVRQRTDLAPLKVITAEYRAIEGVCAKCGKVHKAEFPEGVTSTVSYGESIQSILTYLNIYQLLPLKRATELMEDLLGIKVSQGTIVNTNNQAYESLAEPEKLQKEEIIQSDVAQFDESGMRVCGTNYWLHSASTKTCTVYTIHPKRGKAAMDEMGILPQFRGTAVHDHWKSYYSYECAHAECNQHILRTLAYLFENLGQNWAGEMACLLLRAKRHVDLTKLFDPQAASLAQDDIKIYEGIYRAILAAEESHKANAPVDARRLLNRLAEYEQESLLFMHDFDVPFTNNLAERDIRMPKAKQKISGGFRSEEGAKAFARVRAFVSTTKKRGKSVFDGLTAVFKGEATKFLYPEHEPSSV
jgi:transposase-like protein